MRLGWLALSGFAFALLAGACSGSGREFGNCKANQKSVDNVCRQTCTDTCPGGETCQDGVCMPGCGDGKLGEREKCDDGNDAEGDGCVACKVETHYQCDTSQEPSECRCESGYQDNDGDGSCDADCDSAALDCGARGACDDSSGAALCKCDDGYQDNDHAGGCRPSCDTAALQCGKNGACSDASGTAECACDEGYQDNDGNGACGESCSVVDCGANSTCNDATGKANCTCKTGFQDHDDNGSCEPDCSDVTCGTGATCDDSSGAADCVCNKGYQDYDQDGTCEQGCTKVNCGANGECDDTSGVVRCACAAGYQDNDNKNGCSLDCVKAALSCGANSQCDDSSGLAKCQCKAGYQDNDGKNGCSPTCAQSGIGCGVHASCDDSSGTATCVCEEHYTDPGKDGACEQGTCYVSPGVCGATKYCDRANDVCIALPEVPNGDFSCKSGDASCAPEWTMTQGITIGNDCGGGLTLGRSAFVQPSPGVYGDYYARVTVPVPAYATIDPPGAGAGPFAIAFDTGQFCVPGDSGPACPTQGQPGPAVALNFGGTPLGTLKAGTTANCNLPRYIACLGQSAYGKDGTLGLRPTAQTPTSPAIPLWLLTFTNISLVRDASCPVPGVISFKPGDFGGAVIGTQNDPYVDLSFGNNCTTPSAQADVSVPTSPKSVIELMVTATADSDGVYPQLDVNISRSDGLAMTLGSYTATSAQQSTLRYCVEHSFFGGIAKLELEGTPKGNKCSASGPPLLRIRQLKMTTANAGECP